MRSLFGKKKYSNAEQRLVHFTGSTSPSDLPEVPGDAFEPTGSGDLVEKLKALKAADTKAGKEIEMILRAWLSKVQGASSESIGFHQSADGSRTTVTRLSYLNNKIIGALKGMGVAESEIAAISNAMPVNNEEMVELMVRDVGFISEEAYNTMMSQRASQRSNPGPKDRRRMEVLRRNIARYESASHRGRYRTRSTYRRRARNARHQLRLFESGKKSYDPVHGQARSRYVRGRGKFWETYSSNTGKWSRSTEVEPVDFAAIRARLAIRDKEKAYATNSITGKTYTKKEYEGLQLLKRWNQSGRSPVWSERRRRARSVANIMGWKYDELKGRAYRQKDRDAMAKTNAYFGTNFDLDYSLKPSDVGFLSHVASARGAGADVRMSGTSAYIDRIAPKRRAEAAKRAQASASRRAELEIKKFASQYAKDIGVPAGTKVEVRDGYVYIGNNRQLQFSTDYEFVDGAPVYEFTIVNHGIVANATVKDGVSMKQGLLLKSASYEDAVKMGQGILGSEEFAAREEGKAAKVAEGAVKPEDQEAFDNAEKKEKLIRALRQKEALVKAALGDNPNMGSSQVRTWIADDLESGTIFIQFPGNVDWHAIHLDADGEKITNLTYNTSRNNSSTEPLKDQFDEEQAAALDALINGALNAESAKKFIDLCSECSDTPLNGVLEKRTTLGGKNLEKSTGFWLNQFSILDSNENMIYFVRIHEDGVYLFDRNGDSVAEGISMKGKTTEQVLIKLEERVKELVPIEIGPEDATESRVTAALNKKVESDSQVAGFDIEESEDFGERHFNLFTPGEDEDASYEIYAADTFFMVTEYVEDTEDGGVKEDRVVYMSYSEFTTDEAVAEIERVVTALKSGPGDVASPAPAKPVANEPPVRASNPVPPAPDAVPAPVPPAPEDAVPAPVPPEATTPKREDLSKRDQWILKIREAKGKGEIDFSELGLDDPIKVSSALKDIIAKLKDKGVTMKNESSVYFYHNGKRIGSVNPIPTERDSGYYLWVQRVAMELSEINRYIDEGPEVRDDGTIQLDELGPNFSIDGKYKDLVHKAVLLGIRVRVAQRGDPEPVVDTVNGPDNNAIGTYDALMSDPEKEKALVKILEEGVKKYGEGSEAADPEKEKRASEQLQNMNSLAETVHKELEIKDASGYSTKIELDGDAFLVNFTHKKYGTYTIEIEEDGKTIKGFRKNEKIKDDSYDPSKYIGEDFFALRNTEDETLSEPARNIVSLWLPQRSLIDDYVERQDIKEQRAKSEEEEMRADRHESMKRMITSATNNAYEVTPSKEGDHDRYTLTKPGETIVVDTKADAPIAIASIVVNGKDISIPPSVRDLLDFEKILKEVQIQTGTNAPPEPNLFSGKTPVSSVSGDEKLDDLLNIDSTTGEKLPVNTEPSDAPKIAFPDEAPPPAPPTEAQLQADLDKLLSPDEGLDSPELADNK